MRRALFGLWLAGSIGVLFLIGQLVHPPAAHFGSPSSLIIVALWSVGVVPLSFVFWFKASRAREQQAVSQALTDWQQGVPGAGAEVARALELVLSEEDEAALRRFLELLAHPPPALEPAVQPFIHAAQAWLADDGGLSSRDEHLERVKVAFRHLGPQLSGAPKGSN